MNAKRLARMENKKATWQARIDERLWSIGARKNGENGFIVLPQGLTKTKKKDFAHKMPEVLKLKGHTYDISDSAMNWTESDPFSSSTNGGFNSRGWEHADTGTGKGKDYSIKGGHIQLFR